MQLRTKRDQTARFVMVGGYLGAGKTTTLGLIGRRLAAAGHRVAVLTNDPVDTNVAEQGGLPVREVTGGCFCARFGELVKRCDELLDAIAPDVLLAEPVGSFADLSATVLQPLKRYYGDGCELAPYTVLADAERLDSLLDGPAAASPIGYLYRKQMEEADLLLLNKADLLSAEQIEQAVGRLQAVFPATPLRAVSALTGTGIDDWWDDLANGPRAGWGILDLDYDTYAAAEAALGWLETGVTLTGDQPFEPVAVATAWLADLRHQVVRQAAELGHVKVLVQSATGATRVSLTHTAGRPTADLAALPAAPAAELMLTARAELPPDELERLVLASLRRVANDQGLNPTVRRLKCLRPGRPKPVHRLARTD